MFNQHRTQEVHVKLAGKLLNKNKPGVKGYTSPQPGTSKGHLISYDFADGCTLEILYIVGTGQLWYILYQGEDKLAQLRYSAQKNGNGKRRAELWLTAYGLQAELAADGEKLAKHVRLHKKK